MPVSLEDQLIEEIASHTHDPLSFVNCAYPWGSRGLEQSNGPYVWQKEIFTYISNHLTNSRTRHTPCMIAVSSGHGIGKSACISMVIDWAMSTAEDCKCVITANTGTQLATKTMPEIHKWFRLSANSHWWDMKATSITVRDPEHAKLWRADMVPWSKENTEAFAGLHNHGKRILLVFDEASAIDDTVWQVAEGAMTDEETEIIFLAFGNPTQNVGRFRECFGSLKHRWRTFQIDSRTVEGTNKEQIAKWIDDYGEDSDFVRVRVRGEFPRAGSSQFIPGDVVAACRKYRAEGYESLPKILSVDVARFGSDQTVLIVRQGRHCRILAKYRGMDTVQVAERVIEFMEKEKPNALIVDGDGIGGGVIDQIKFRNYGSNLFEFHGASTANDSAMYFNRRAEVWGMMRDWLVAGAEIPDDAELASDLTSPEYGFSSKQSIQLERKEDMVKRGLSSPDVADAIAYSFAVNVAPPPPKPKVEYRYPGQDAYSWMQS